MKARVVLVALAFVALRLPLQEVAVSGEKFAAGQFGNFQVADFDELRWVEPPNGRPGAVDLFVAHCMANP